MRNKNRKESNKNKLKSVNEKDDGQETYKKKNKPNKDEGGKGEIQNKNKY
jgi:hypothetical protein